MKAILSADIIGSTELPLPIRSQLAPTVKQAFQALKVKPAIKYSIERGDFIQGEVPAEDGLQYLLLLKAQLNSITDNNQDARQENILVDLRISLALGEVTLSAKTVGESDGPAYQLSGRALDDMKSARQLISLQSTDEDFNDELLVMAKSLEFITARWTKGSAEIVSLLVEGQKEIDIAEKLGISQSAVNQRKKTAGWDVLNAMLNRYKKKSIQLKQA